MTTGARLLVVDDDATYRLLLQKELARRGYVLSAAPSVAAAKTELEANDLDVALIDLRLPDGDGLEIVRFAREQCPRVELVVLTGHGTIDTAIEAMRAGAYDYLRKPCSIDELDVTLQKALERQALIRSNMILRDGYAVPDIGPGFVGQSAVFRELCALIDRVAATDATALVLGETGVGKDIVARMIHARSPRAKQPLIVVECAALHEDLLHNELFGHDKGAYTGAAAAKHGLFEVADGGTLFLDEIGDVSLATQVKLLRVIETGTFRHVGGTREIKVDVRIVAATNRNLQELMEREYFRRDLFYRLSTIRLEVPPLRERPSDIPVLVDHFLERFNKHYSRRKRFSSGALGTLVAYHWPGNVRELLHVVEHGMIVSEGDVVEAHHLPSELRAGARSSGDAGDAGVMGTLVDVEREHIRRVLEAVRGNRSQASRILGISERTLYRKIRYFDELGPSTRD